MLVHTADGRAGGRTDGRTDGRMAAGHNDRYWRLDLGQASARGRVSVLFLAAVFTGMVSVAIIPKIVDARATVFRETTSNTCAARACAFLALLPRRAALRVLAASSAAQPRWVVERTHVPCTRARALATSVR